MKTSKKILLLFVSLTIVCAISTIIAYSLFFLFNISFWGIFGLSTAVQIGWSIFRFQYIEEKERKATLALMTEYLSKPFRRYIIEMNCAHCGHKNEIEVDLNNTEFKCENCKKYNGLHVNFMAAAITEPLVNTEL